MAQLQQWPVPTGLCNPRLMIPTAPAGWFVGAMCVIRDRFDEDPAKTLQEQASELETLFGPWDLPLER